MKRHHGDNKRGSLSAGAESDPDAWRDSFVAPFPGSSADEVTVDTLANMSVVPDSSHGPDTDAEDELSEPTRRPGYLGESARIGKYAVLRQLGEGGMGVVYSAYDEELDRRVALKLIRPGRDNSPANQLRMQREARAMARLSHANVVQVYEVGRWEQQVYLAMEFVQGRTLGSWLKAQTRPWQSVLDVMVQAGRGLAAAHQADIVHGDFKPDNILIDDQDHARVVDFGLARAAPRTESYHSSQSLRRDAAVADPGSMNRGSLASGAVEPDPEHQHTSAPDAGVPMPEPGRSHGGRVAGTPAYMAAEQHAGRQPDVRTDQFAFAVTLYTALYGHHPFAGGSLLELVINVSDGKIRPPPADSPVPAGVHAAIVRALDRDPMYRFESMADLLDALNRGSGRARDPEFDLSVARPQRVMLSMIIPASILAITVVLIIYSPEGSLLPSAASNAIAGAVINVVLFGLIFAFRGSFFKNTINRRVMAWLVVSSLAMLVHRTTAVVLDTPVATTMVNDLLMLGAIATMAGIAIERWIWYSAGVMLAGALLCAAFPAVSSLILVASLIGVFLLAFRFWSR
ncbi:serine/threonine-protein kinase [Nannocystis radixulma]|uniref:Serine/threonine-protein kinase n=1 Tax=Nannocystis radixulma TaxID=2995305 RepID=A0ABT5AXM3_9BACT|nr:serine/threonine-protein kinase [Nannocystis radixulma]MDC0666581.1 serine/threonine-protein kinase [Nannocystis radixulma]